MDRQERVKLEIAALEKRMAELRPAFEAKFLAQLRQVVALKRRVGA